ncbi:MAG: pyridoxamine 5'-phosphate oxidase family protein [Pelovirga sp.]
MRRHEKEVTDRTELEEILQQGRICHLAIPAGAVPYLVPMNYAYRDGQLYFHSAPAGRKMELLQSQPLVSFSVVIDGGVVETEEACNWSSRFRSVIGQGRIELVEREADKCAALHLLMAQFSDKHFTFAARQVAATAIFRLVITTMSGKESRM